MRTYLLAVSYHTPCEHLLSLPTPVILVYILSLFKQTQTFLVVILSCSMPFFFYKESRAIKK